MDHPYRNLLTDRWLSVRLADGSRDKIRLNEIGRKDVVDLVAPRADFRGALYQLLIGLLQTAFAQSGRREWKSRWETPPDASTLTEAFAPFVPAFYIDAPVGTPAFMQDLELVEGEQKPVSSLLIDAPGGNTIKKNQDIFVKRGGVGALSVDMAALALFTLQINAPSGGQGHRVSLRGGGPLTTLILPPEGARYGTLWHRLWLNVMTLDEFTSLPGDHRKTDLDAIFPWMATTPTSEKPGTEIFPQQVNPLQAFWSMPRRIRLHFEAGASVCDVSGEQVGVKVAHYATRNFGINYAGSWMHPLTPYALEEGQEPRSIKAQPGGLGYRDWLGLIVPGQKGKSIREPAAVVQRYSDRRNWIEDADFHPRLWAFGYDTDNMKARCWYETEMPFFNLESEQRDDVAGYVQKMIDGAESALWTLKSSLKKAWFDRPADAKGDMSFVDANFWSATEIEFYRLLGNIISHLEVEERIDALLENWRQILRDQAQTIFDQYALSSFNEDGDLKRAVLARDGKKGLLHYLDKDKAIRVLSA